MINACRDWRGGSVGPAEPASFTGPARSCAGSSSEPNAAHRYFGLKPAREQGFTAYICRYNLVAVARTAFQCASACTIRQGVNGARFAADAFRGQTVRQPVGT